MPKMTPREALSRLLQSADFQRFEDALGRASAFHVLGIATRELSHAALLGWLLNPRAHHGLSVTPLRSFLMLVCGLADGARPTPDAVELDSLDLHSVEVELERTVTVPGTKRQRRLDIVLSLSQGAESRVLLIVEYKVDASETEEQTLDYAAWASAQTAKHAWPTEPHLIYLCPGGGEPASERFGVMDYDLYVSWLDGLLARHPSETARFLIQELRACLSQRADVQDAQQDALRAELLAAEPDAYATLSTLSGADRAALLPAMMRHREALEALGLSVNTRRSKGPSAFVALFRERLKEHLDPDVWRISEGSGSLTLVYLPATQVVREVTGFTGGISSALRAHLFMERPRSERARMVLEVIGAHPALDPVEHRKLARVPLANSLRERFVEHFDDPATGQIIGAYILGVPGVKAPADDTASRVAGLSPQLHATALRIQALGAALEGWLPELRAQLEAMQP